MNQVTRKLVNLNYLMILRMKLKLIKSFILMTKKIMILIEVILKKTHLMV